jgi:hypothetical protein
MPIDPLEGPIERQGRLLAEEAKERKAQIDRILSAGDAERKALNERAAANFRAAENERQRVAAQDAQVAHEQALREALRQSYIQANGAEFGFAEAFPRLRAAHVEAQTLANLAPKPATTKEIVERVLALRYGKTK